MVEESMMINPRGWQPFGDFERMGGGGILSRAARMVISD